jgi:hypothetical protein
VVFTTESRRENLASLEGRPESNQRMFTTECTENTEIRSGNQGRFNGMANAYLV